MKRNKSLFIFIGITIIGLFLINFIYDSYLKNREVIDMDNLQTAKDYKVSVALKGLKNPTSFAVDKDNNIYIAENENGIGKISMYTPRGKYKPIAEDLIAPVSQITIHKGTIYISHKGSISKLQDGRVQDIINGLPSTGDYSNNGIAFGYDGMIYICQGSATNSGVVGMDNYENGWLAGNPYFHDYPPVDVVIGGINFKTKNPFSADKNVKSNTGIFLPFNSISLRSEAIKGRIPGNASIIRVALDGSITDTYAWGVRNPVGIIIMSDTRVFITSQGMEDRGSRPIANGKDYIYEVKKGEWLGWPDYEGGEPVVLKKFKSKNNPQIQFVMELHPTISPSKPLAAFNESGRIGIMDICSNSSFGLKGQLFIPFKKGKNEPAKIIAFDLKSNKSVDFITNKDNSDFLEKPVQCGFSKDGKLYVLDNSKGMLLKVEKNVEVPNKFLPSSLPMEYFVGVLVIAFIIYLVFVVRSQGKGKKK